MYPNVLSSITVIGHLIQKDTHSITWNHYRLIDISKGANGRKPMLITEDKIGETFTAKVREGEYIKWRGQLDWNDKNPGLRLEYWFGGEKIAFNRVEEKWWWKFAGGHRNQLEKELQWFLEWGMNRATEIRNANAKSAEMAADANAFFKDE